MPGLTDYMEERFLRHFFGGAAQAQPAGLWVGLASSAPTDSTTGTELTGLGYARVPFTSAFSQNADGRWQMTNAAIINFAVAGVGGWGLVTYYTIWNALTGGQQMAYAQLTDPASGYVTAMPKQVDYGDSMRFDVGFLQVLVD